MKKLILLNFLLASFSLSAKDAQFNPTISVLTLPQVEISTMSSKAPEFKKDTSYVYNVTLKAIDNKIFSVENFSTVAPVPANAIDAPNCSTLVNVGVIAGKIQSNMSIAEIDAIVGCKGIVLQKNDSNLLVKWESQGLGNKYVGFFKTDTDVDKTPRLVVADFDAANTNKQIRLSEKSQSEAGIPLEYELIIPQVKVDDHYLYSALLKTTTGKTFELVSYKTFAPQFLGGSNCLEAGETITPDKASKVKIGMGFELDEIFGCERVTYKTGMPNMMVFKWESRGSGERFIGYYRTDTIIDNALRLVAFDYQPEEFVK